jgi:hypothetical protein
VLRRIFGHTREEVIGVSRKLHSGEHHNLYSPRNIIRMIKSRIIKWTGHVERMRLTRSAHIILVGRPEIKRPLARHRRIWEGNSKLDTNEIAWECGME